MENEQDIEYYEECGIIPKAVAVKPSVVERRPTRGRVRWFSRELRYGFIQEDGANDEIFFHQSSIQVPGTKQIRVGQRVVFEWYKTRRGQLALNVIPILESPEKLEKQRQKNQEST